MVFHVGSFRIYFKIPFLPIGIKIPRFSLKQINSLNTFLAGMIMNILERKRYQRFVLHKSFGYKFKPQTYKLNPTYFCFFGLFSVVRHCQAFTSDDLLRLGEPEHSPYSEEKCSSIGWFEGQLYEIDYGDFSMWANNTLNLREVDYK